jgi:hypothetical protein
MATTAPIGLAQITNMRTRSLVYGPGGSGKSVLFGATQTLRTFVFDVDDSLLSVKNWPNVRPELITIWPVQTSADFQTGMDWVRPRLGWYDLLVVDTASQLQAIYHEEIQRAGKFAKDPRQEWGETLKWSEWLARSFRHLPVHVLWTAHEIKYDQPGLGTVYRPSFRGQFGVEHDKHFALIAHYEHFMVPTMGVDGKPTGQYQLQRWLNCHKDPTTNAKDRSGTLLKYEPPNLDALIAKMTRSTTAGDIIRHG